jgi:ATP phosphoribosyltransferase regulatory subunit
MSDWKIHTPEGVNDILPQECGKKREIEDTIWSVFASFGYREVQTPMFEYYDVFEDVGGQLSQEVMYKFFDEHGRILTLRPDITTSIARMAATKETGKTFPLRYCYNGSVFRAEQTQGARQREFTQAGIELIGSSSPRADAEVIGASIEAVLAVGIEQFQMEIGQVAFFNGLIEQAGLGADDTEKLRERIDCKDSLGIRELMDELDIDESVKSVMIELPYLFGGREVIEKANVAGLNETSKNALDNIAKIYDLLCEYGFEQYISLDLGMLQSIDYYTGSIFKCYTHGIAFPICAGGRYDNLMSRFGVDAGAVGAAFGINRILSALRSAGADSETRGISATLVFAEEAADAEAYEVAFNLRVSGCLVEMYLEDGDYRAAEEYAVKTNAGCMMRVFADGRLMLKDFIKNEIVETTVKDFLSYYEEDDCCGHEHHHDCCGCEE